MAEQGKAALARLLERLGLGTDAATEEVWSDFQAAVAGAQAEIREREADGVARWRQARHGG